MLWYGLNIYVFPEFVKLLSLVFLFVDKAVIEVMKVK